MSESEESLGGELKHPMEVLFNQIHVAARLNLYYLALFAALTLPDICAAMDAPDGEAHKPLYIQWFDKFVAPLHSSGASGTGPITGQVAYELRCSILHQARARDPKHFFAVVGFVPAANPMTSVTLAIGKLTVNGKEEPNFLALTIVDFCEKVLTGARTWLDSARGTDLFELNYERFVRLRPEGYKFYVKGPVII